MVVNLWPTNPWPRYKSHSQVLAHLPAMPKCRGRPYTYRFNRDTVFLHDMSTGAITVEHLSRSLMTFTPDDVVTIHRVDRCVAVRFEQLLHVRRCYHKYKLIFRRTLYLGAGQEPEMCLATEGTQIYLPTNTLLLGRKRKLRVPDKSKRNAWAAEFKKFNRILRIAHELGAFKELERQTEYDPNASDVHLKIIQCVRDQDVQAAAGIVHSQTYYPTSLIRERWQLIVARNRTPIYKQLGILEAGDDSYLVTVPLETVRGNAVPA